MYKTSIQIHRQSITIHNESPTTSHTCLSSPPPCPSSPPPGLWGEVGWFIMDCFFSDPGVVPRRVLPRRVIAPHRRWMPRKQSSRQRNRLPGNTVLYNQAHRGVPGMQQPIRPHSTSARASGRYSRDTATRSSLLAADPGPNCPGILIPLLEPLRRVTPLYNLVVGGPVRGPHGGTHPKAVSRGQTHPASGPFLPRHAALNARPLASRRHPYPSCKHYGVPLVTTLVTTINSGSPAWWADGVGDPSLSLCFQCFQNLEYDLLPTR